jgi:hypothetical protein
MRNKMGLSGRILFASAYSFVQDSAWVACILEFQNNPKATQITVSKSGISYP